MRNLFFNADLVLTGAVISGLFGGYWFYRLWRRVAPHSRARLFWQKLPNDVRTMLTCENPSDMVKHYKALLSSIFAYAGRSTLALALGLTPMAALFFAVAAWDPSGRLAKEAVAHPAKVVGDLTETRSPWRLSRDRLLVDRESVGESGVHILGESLDSTMLARKHAFCRSSLNCLLFEMMLFETHRFAAERDVGHAVVIRPVLLDSNPFWPYLNDLDFWFFIAAMAGSTGAAWLRRPDASQGE